MGASMSVKNGVKTQTKLSKDKSHADESSGKTFARRSSLTTMFAPSHRNNLRVLSADDSVCGSIEMSIDVGKPAYSLLRMISENVIGKDTMIWTPFGKRRLIYADYTASGRLLSFTEEYMRNAVLPLYANTHTEASATGFQTTVLREEARHLIAESVNAPVEDFATLFVGTGCTGAIDKLGRVLGLNIAASSADQIKNMYPTDNSRPVVFHGPFEHHTNELWWRESIATVIAIREDDSGQPDLKHLEAELQKYASRTLKIGSFSAGSNVTGIRADTTRLAELLHSYGAFAFFDFAGVGAYVKIDMNPVALTPGGDASMDAIFMSPHKFIGGPGACGLLIAKRKLFTNSVPTCPGGGTVCYVGPHGHDYDDEIEAREDGGTPGILQAIRCGLAFLVKERVGCDVIEHAEQAHGRAALHAWKDHPSILLMGSDRSSYFEYSKRVSIISFNILAPASMEIDGRIKDALPGLCRGRLILHPHFVIQVPSTMLAYTCSHMHSDACVLWVLTRSQTLL